MLYGTMWDRVQLPTSMPRFGDLGLTAFIGQPDRHFRMSGLYYEL